MNTRVRLRGPSSDFVVCLTGYFLKRSSKAWRASLGREAVVGAAGMFVAYATGEVSFSTVMRYSKNVQSFFASFFAIRSGIGWVHSNCFPVSKWTHCLQECNAAWHLGHSPL